MKKTKVSFDLSIADYHKIEEIAKVTGNSRSSVIRMLIATALGMFDPIEESTDFSLENK
jgi:hypothetical protein